MIYLLDAFIIDLQLFIIDLQLFIIDIQLFIIDIQLFIIDIQLFIIDLQLFIIDLQLFIIDLQLFIIDMNVVWWFHFLHTTLWIHEWPNNDYNFAAMRAIFQSLSVEWAESGVRINSVAPGSAIYSPTASANYGDFDVFEQVKPQLPSKRLGTPREVS